MQLVYSINQIFYPHFARAVDKALFEATKNLGERDRYIKVIQDLTSWAAKIVEKIKEKGEKEGFVSSSL